MTLNSINKASPKEKQCYKHNFLDIYEIYFDRLKNSYLSILEIGLWHGNSLRLWQQYFPNAIIRGIDKSTDCIAFSLNNIDNHDRIGFFQVDQGNINELMNFSNGKKFDIIIDDGSHFPPHQIISFRVLFEFLNAEGLYCVEDLHTSYQGTRPSLSVDFFSQLIHNLNYQGKVPILENYKECQNLFSGDEGRYEFIHFYPGLCIIKKR